MKGESKDADSYRLKRPAGNDLGGAMKKKSKTVPVKAGLDTVIKDAKVVQGYYSDDDVKILLDALIKEKGLQKTGELVDMKDSSFITDIWISGGKKTVVLSAILEGEGNEKGRISQLQKELVTASNVKIDQILIPINKPGVHWYSLKLLLDYSTQNVYWYLHDSLNKHAATLNHISKSLSSTIVNAFNIREEQFVRTESSIPLLQQGVTGGAINSYCGGYTARLMANLVENTAIDQDASLGVWSCPDNNDSELRKQDVAVVNTHNTARAGGFGSKPMYASEAQLKSKEAEFLRNLVATKKATIILKALSNSYDGIAPDTKEHLKALDVPKDSKNLVAFVRQLYAKLPFLKELFQIKDDGEIEENEDGELKINMEIEVEHVYGIIKALKRECYIIEGINPEEAESDENMPEINAPIAEGLKYSLHGNLYQWSLLTWVTLKASSERKFTLITEAAGYEKFDDLVLKYDDEILFLQAKHSSKESEKDDYKKSDFTSNDYKGEASLAKYFDSWYRLEKGEHRKKKKHYVFFTNRGIKDFVDFLEDFSSDIPQLEFEGGITKTLKFSSGDTRKDFIDAIRKNSKKVGDYKGDLEPQIKDVDIEEANKYLEKKFEEYESTQKFEVSARGKHKLTTVQQYMIKLALTDDEVFSSISDDDLLKDWLRAKDSKGEFKVTFTKKISSHKHEKVKDFKEIKQYLKDKFRDYTQAKQAVLQVDGSAQISDRAQAVIKLAQIDPEVLERISENAALKDWFSLKDEKGDNRILVKIENYREVLSNIFEKEINKFLDQLVLKVKQPNFVAMSKKIYTEMSEVTPIAAAEFCANIELKVLRWFGDPKDCDLSSDEIRKMILSAKGDALRFYLLADNANPHALQGSALLEIKTFLEDKSNIICIQKSSGIELRIAQTIKEQGFAQDSYVFFNIASPYLEYVATILHGEQMQIVVFDFSSYEPDDLKILKKLLDVAIHNKKKVILLSKDDDKNFMEYGSFIYIDNKLSDEQIEKAVKDKEDSVVNIAGKNYVLGAFLADKASGVYQAMKHPNFFYEILNQPDQDNLDSGLLHEIYIKNKLLNGEAIYNWRNILSTVRTNLFVIKGAVRISEIKEALIGGKDNAQKRLVNGLDEEITKETTYRLISKKELLDGFIDKPPIRQICIDDTLVPEEIQYDNYVVLSIIEDGKAIIDNVKAVALPIAESYRFEEKNVIGREHIIEKNFCVVSANAGYGKSSFCFDQRAIWLEGKDNQFLWVVRLDLSRLDFKGEEANIFELFNKKTSGLDWSDWQLEALMHDMRYPGKVKILLDGFDEIKYSTVIKKLGDWIVSIPKEVNLIITTRPYAAHNIPMPDNRNLDLFLTLQEYDSKDKEKYIRDYILAVIKGASPRHINDVIKKYQKLSMSSSDSVLSLLGVPLEMYLFCEAFEFEILEDYRALKEGGEILQRIEGVELGTVDLFEKFLVKKLSIFLSKHLEIENHLRSSRGEHLTYVTTSLYTDILQVFAFKQAFDLDYEIVNNALRERYYDEYVMQELKETGLVLVEKKGTEYVLKFNHATYQEYFAALKIISGLCSNNGDVQQIFRQYKHYMPHYQVIFGFAGQLSLCESKFLSRIDQDQFLRIQKFWGALYGDISDSHDLLGEAEFLLVGRCLSVLSSEDIEVLERSTLDKSWHKRLTRLSKDPNLDRRARKEAQAAPVERTQIEEEHKEHDIEEQIKKYCDDKNRLKELRDYVSSFGKVTQSKVRGLLSRELESREEWDYEGSYWALDFGISAVALCGEHFSRNLADKLKTRADMWSNNFNHALNVWNEIVGTAWREHSKDVADSVSYALSQFLQSKNACSFFEEEIPNLRQVVGAFMQYTRINFDYATSIIEILKVAKKASYAVVVSSDNSMLELIGDDHYPISVNHHGFREAMEVLKSTQCDDPIAYINLVRANHKFSELQKRYEFESELSDLTPQEMEKYFKDRFDEFSEHKKLEQLKSFFHLLEELKPGHLDFVKRIFAENFFAAMHKANSYWDYDFGSRVIGYCGIYVNEGIVKGCCSRDLAMPYVKKSCDMLIEDLTNELDRLQDCSKLNKIYLALSEIAKLSCTDDISLFNSNDWYITKYIKPELIEWKKTLFDPLRIKIEYLHNLRCHIENGRTLHQAKVLLECGIMPSNDMKLDVSGEGSYSVNNYLFGDAFEAYFLSRLEKLLKLRLLDLKNLDFDFLVIRPTETSNEIEISQNVITFLENSELDKIVVLPLLIPADPIGRMKHWVGVIIERKLRDITIKYLDSENQVINLVVANQLELEKLGFSIVMDQIYVEQQRYRNCGSELIENFIYYMTGSRSTQEAAIYVHSLLLENALLDPIEYALKISENNKLIGFLSNQVSLMVDRPATDTNSFLAMSMQQAAVRFEISLATKTYFSELLLARTQYLYLETFDHVKQANVQQTLAMFGDSVLVIDDEVSSNQEPTILPIQSGDFSVVSSTTLVAIASGTYDSSGRLYQDQGSDFFTFIHTLTDKITSTLSNGLMNIGGVLIDIIMKNNYIKQQLINYVYHEELSAINIVINKPYIQLSAILAVQLLLQKHPLQWSKKDFKNIKLVVHPDKGGKAEDFRTVNAFQEQVGDKDQIYQNLLPKLLPNIQTIIHKSNIGFKVLDMVVDSGRLIYEPTLVNAKKVALDSTYLYSMYYGVNSYSSIISAVDVLQLAYQEEYTQALKQASTTIAYMALPSLLAYTAIPQLGLAYGIGMATYTAYNAITNSYSFYLERSSDAGSTSKSTMAYRDLTQTLSESPLQQLYDFTKIAKGYEVQLNNLALAEEKEALKSKLVEEKGEFGQKLYDYIYKPLLEEKYDLSNQLLLGDIKKEDTENLKAKHIAITLDNQSYNKHCMEIKGVVNNDESGDTDVEQYYCYNTEKKLLEHVIIEDNHFEIVNSL